jgi:hypothetical protein
MLMLSQPRAKRRHVTRVYELPAARYRKSAGRELFSPGTKRKAAALAEGSSVGTVSSSASTDSSGSPVDGSSEPSTLSPTALFKKAGAEIFKMLKNPYCLDDWYLYDTMVRSVFSLSRDVPHHMVLFVPALCCGWLSYVFRLHVHDIFYLCRQVVTPEMEAFILVTVTNFFNGSSNPSVILHVFTGCSLLSLQYVFVDRISA